MIMTKIALAFSLAALVVAATAGYDTWSNRRKYAARERKRTAQGGLE
jgi:uncharacterized iron-regulated membrane protein